jgi:HAD superfamily hydrolase (TIGR01509 family)
MPFKLSAVIFDMDGLMLDTETLARDAWRQALAEVGYALSDELYLQLLGRTIEDTQAILRQALGADLPIESLARRKGMLVRQHIDQHGLRLKTGLAELLDWLKTHAIAHAVASSAKRPDVLFKLSHAGFGSWFDTVVTGDQVSAGKPAPDIFLAAARQLQVPAAECAVLEDSDAGIRAAHAAGMLPLMVPDLKPPSQESLALAHQIFPSLHEAKNFLEATLLEGAELG